MIIKYRIKKIGKAEKPVLTDYSTCCEKNLNRVFSGILIPKFIHNINKYRMSFNGFEISNCPYCGADINFIES